MRWACIGWLGLVLSGLLGDVAFAQRVKPIQAEEVEYQTTAYKQWWNSDWDRKLKDLPTKGSVPEFRVPYSGHDYPDRGGGTIEAMKKYDSAYHRGEMMAARYEREDVRNGRKAPRTREQESEDRPFRRLFSGFGFRRIPSWYGHCNGWTAASIRHAEPQRNVIRNGVVFTPADIKGMLAEVYMYNDTEFLGGVDAVINPGTLHLSLANWLGRGSHPIGMDNTLGEVVFNYPIYAYKSELEQVSSQRFAVDTTITYAVSTAREANEKTRVKKEMRFHYLLELDSAGQVIGGSYYRDSAKIDMLWAPLKPVAGGRKGNELGNPFLNVSTVLSIWRESVPEDLRDKWWNIDPTSEDRLNDADSDSTDAVTAENSNRDGSVDATATRTVGNLPSNLETRRDDSLE